MKIVSGSSNRPLAEKIAFSLNIPLVKSSLKIFSNKEFCVKIFEELTGEDVFVIQSTSFPVNDNLMELMITLDAIKSNNPRSVTAVIPYFGYSRQDRQTITSSSIPANLIAQLIITSGADKIITVDLHSEHLRKFSNLSLQNVPITSVFYEAIASDYLPKDTLIISPDQGGIDRAHALAKLLNLDVVSLYKRRHAESGTCIMSLETSVKGRPCILIDDIVDTAETLCKASETLKQAEAKSVKAYITHGVLTGDAVKRIEASCLDNVYITDSIYSSILNHKCLKIQSLSVAPLIIEALTTNLASGLSPIPL
ncbi:MAG: hypothetical protein BGO77_04675 [Caedibacter sp. 37-49]|nr:MAG: hypothetical protein BGO77_04675 [Caedibacter sp. 37-49]